MNGNEDRWARRFLVALVFVVPLVPNPGLFTNADAPKWAVLVLGALGVFAVILYRSVRTKDKVRLLLPEHLSLLALVVVAAILFRVWAADESASLRALALIGTLTALAIAGGQYLRDDAWVRRFLDAALAAGALVSAVGIAQWLAGASPTSTFGNPSFAAEFVAPSLCIAAGAFLAGRRRAALAAGIPMLLFLVLARSRADWVALAAGLAVIAVLTLLIRSGRRPPRRVLTGAILVAAVLVPYVPQLVPLPVFGRRDTVEVRRLVRKSTLDMALDHKAVGVGLEGFRGTYPKYRDPEEARLSLRREVTFAHNLPLQVFAEVGVGGLLLLMLFLWVPISSGLRTLAERPADPVAPGATGAVVAVFVSAQLSAPLRHPASALLLFTLSALLVARRPRRFVTDLKGRYRKAVVVLLLLFPVAAAAAVLPKHLGADHYLARARAREAAQDGGMDAEVARLLTRSIDLEPGPDALRQLAFYRTGTGEPKRALALLGVLMDLSPHDEQGRIETARARLALEEPEAALRLLDPLVAARPGDDVALFLRARARWDAKDDQGALTDFLAALKVAPEVSARRHTGWVNELPEYFQDQVLNLAARIAEEDLEHGLAIIEEVKGPEAAYRKVLVLVDHREMDRAMELLRMMRRFVASERLRHDPRLDPLRHRADFRVLLEGD